MKLPTKPIRSHRTPTSLRKFLYGSPYYPEHWEDSIRTGDPALFRAAGWNVIRMAEFAWDIMEPGEGVYDFSLFAETVARFGAEGIRTILCTPTAAPPRWLTLRHPEMLRVDDRGVTQCHGSRQHASLCSPVFRGYGRRIVSAMADFFRTNPDVIGWQTDNEFHCHFRDDHSPAAEAAFVEFLRERHGTIDALNRAWGTAFWAQTYRAFEEVPTPREGRPTHLNPAHVLDYQRFLSHAACAFQREQVDILRAANPAWWITHNGCFGSIDYAGGFFQDLDFPGYDSYPFFERNAADRAASHAANLDHTRAFAGNFLILEHQSGPGGQADYLHDTPEPGEMRRMAWTSIARGADGLLFFRERSCRFGAEEFWCGILDHDNVPRRRYHEAAQLGAELARIGDGLLNTSVEITMGIAGGDFAAQHGHFPITHGLPDPRKMGELIHGHYFRQGQAIGFVHPADQPGDLKSYFIPHFSVLDPAWVPVWESWVRDGGVLIVGARTGVKDLNGNVVSTTLPGALRELAGVSVEEYGKQNRPLQRPLRLAPASGGPPVATDLWYEQLEPAEGTEVAATWIDRHLAGSVAITCRRHGAGAVLYVGTYFSEELLQALEPLLLSLGALTVPAGHVAGVEQVVRVGQGGRIRFFINHNGHAVEVPLLQPGHELIRNIRAEERLSLEPNDVAIVKESR